MIERMRVALRRWTSRPTWNEVLAGYTKEFNADAEVRSWRYEPAPEEVPGAPPTDKMQLGTHAKRLLDDPVMKLAFERVASNLTNTWRKSAVGEHEAREATYRLHWALEAVKDELRYFMNNTALIVAEMRRKEEAQSRS